MLVRQAHPGPAEPPYRDLAEKHRDAWRYVHDEGIPWPVLVDDLEGTTHQVYGGVADPTYLIDADGRVAFYNIWTYAPSLHLAIEELLAQGGRGVVKGGVERKPHMLPSMSDGWRGLRRGWPQSVLDLMVAAPGSPLPFWLGDKLRPLLAPATTRATPFPMAAKLVTWVAVGGAVAWALGRAARGRG